VKIVDALTGDIYEEEQSSTFDGDYYNSSKHPPRLGFESF